jgi:hypothetical protein
MATVLLCAAVSASAQPAAPGKGVEPFLYGAGNRSCGNWLADRGNVTHETELNWVLGWLSASGAFIATVTKGSLRHTDADAVAAWVDKYCRAYPINNIGDAASSLVVELSKPK